MEICEPVQMEVRAYINMLERSADDTNEVDVYINREGHRAAIITYLGIRVEFRYQISMQIRMGIFE